MRRDTTLGMLINMRVGSKGKPAQEVVGLPLITGLHGKKTWSNSPETSLVSQEESDSNVIDSGMRRYHASRCAATGRQAHLQMQRFDR
jgi:hypothetical protein